MATRAQQMRTFDGPPVLSAGFRPFFLMSSVWSAIMVPLWVWLYSGHGPGASVVWHAHEMIFGYLGGVIAGFLLTAVPNWTGRLPVTGAPLLGLIGLWGLGRVAALMPAWTGAGAAIADIAFLAVFAGVVWREVLAGRNWRNLPVAIMVSLLAVCNLVYHAGGPETAIRLALAVTLALVALIGGRIIPSFTTNWLKKRGIAALPVPFNGFDRVVIVLTALSLGTWALEPAGLLAGLFLCATGALNLLRLARWRGHATLAEPLVWSLHLGYAWLGAGLLLLGLAAVPTGLHLPAQSGVHALTAGAMGVMSLAVMTRASLGHTGRPLGADRPTSLVYTLVNLAAVVRVAAPFAPAMYLPGLIVSSILWFGAFGGFVAVYGPKLLSPRLRGG